MRCPFHSPSSTLSLSLSLGDSAHVLQLLFIILSLPYNSYAGTDGKWKIISYFILKFMWNEIYLVRQKKNLYNLSTIRLWVSAIIISTESPFPSSFVIFITFLSLTPLNGSLQLDVYYYLLRSEHEWKELLFVPLLNFKQLSEWMGREYNLRVGEIS